MTPLNNPPSRPSKEELQDILEEIDEDGSGEIEFAEFCQLCAKFLVEEPDEDTMKAELKEAFRVYDKNREGFITTDQGWMPFSAAVRLMLATSVTTPWLIKLLGVLISCMSVLILSDKVGKRKPKNC